jgi:hypothetical protein
VEKNINQNRSKITKRRYELTNFMKCSRKLVLQTSQQTPKIQKSFFGNLERKEGIGREMFKLLKVYSLFIFISKLQTVAYTQ